MQKIQLGTFDLSAYTQSIEFSGGNVGVDPAGLSLRSASRKGKNTGFVVTLKILMDSAAQASALTAYCVDLEDVALYVRSADWYYLVSEVVLKSGKPAAGPMGYLVYPFSLECYCDSPYSYGVTEQTGTTARTFARIAVGRDDDPEYLYALDTSGYIWQWDGSKWGILDDAFLAIDISAGKLGNLAAISAADSKIYTYSAGIWTKHGDKTFKKLALSRYEDTSEICGIDSSDGVYQYSGGAWNSLSKTAKEIAMYALNFIAIVGNDDIGWKYNGSWSKIISGDTTKLTKIAYVHNAGFYHAIRQSDGKIITTNIWLDPWAVESGSYGSFIDAIGKDSDKMIGLTANGLRCEYAHYVGSHYVASWAESYFFPAMNTYDNTEGHLAGEIDFAFTGRTIERSSMAVLIGSDELVLDESALHVETLQMAGRILRYIYIEDFVTGALNWEDDAHVDAYSATGNSDTPGSVFDTDHVALTEEVVVAGGISGPLVRESAYYLFSSPHPTSKPIIMTAELSGAGFVDISADGITWTTVLSAFEAGQVEYSLPAEFMSNVYIRFNGPLDIYYLKFEIEREIQEGIPSIPAGSSAMVTTECVHSVAGSFRPRRKLL